MRSVRTINVKMEKIVGTKITSKMDFISESRSERKSSAKLKNRTAETESHSD